MTEPLINSSFSATIPGLQIAWDSTSMGAFKECPRRYYYSIVCGWVPREESVHITFGLHYHGALERYDHSRARGAPHEDACMEAVRYAMQVTWDRKRNRPWLSDDPNKNRWTLVRSVVWYLEEFRNDPLQTVILSNGKPAVELSFRMELDYKAPDGQHFMMCGHMDRLVTFQDEVYIQDRKTTKSTLSRHFFDKFTPNNQFSTYIFASHTALAQPAAGLIVDAAQIAVTFSRFERGPPIIRPQETLQEWYTDLGIYLGSAQMFAQMRYWPQNDKSCDSYGGCPYRMVCSKAPVTREKWLAGTFQQRIWDPLLIRGDI